MPRPWSVIASVALQAATLVCTVLSYIFDVQLAGFATGLEVLLLVIFVAFWAVVALAVWSAKNWARILLSAGFVFQLGGAIVDAATGTFSYYLSDYVGCALSLVAVILLWLPVSRPFFAKPVPPRIDFE